MPLFSTEKYFVTYCTGKKTRGAPVQSYYSFVRSFQGPRGQTHTHKPRKGVRGRRSRKHTLHTLKGASLKRCGIRGLSRRGPPFGGPPGITGPSARPGRLCTAYRAPRAHHRWFPRLCVCPRSAGASFPICARVLTGSAHPPSAFSCWPSLHCSCVRTRRTSRRHRFRSCTSTRPHVCSVRTSPCSHFSPSAISARGPSSREGQGMARCARWWGEPVTLPRPFPCATIVPTHWQDPLNCGGGTI